MLLSTSRIRCNPGEVTRPITVEEVAISLLIQWLSMSAREAPSHAERNAMWMVTQCARHHGRGRNIMDADRSKPVQQRSDLKGYFFGAYCEEYEDAPIKLNTNLKLCPRLVLGVAEPKADTKDIRLSGLETLHNLRRLLKSKEKCSQGITHRPGCIPGVCATGVYPVVHPRLCTQGPMYPGLCTQGSPNHEFKLKRDQALPRLNTLLILLLE